MWRWDQQEPFGIDVPDENPSGLGVFYLPLRLPGQYYDKETGLHYNYFRDHDPSIGRYEESDPVSRTPAYREWATSRGPRIAMQWSAAARCGVGSARVPGAAGPCLL